LLQAGSMAPERLRLYGHGGLASKNLTVANALVLIYPETGGSARAGAAVRSPRVFQWRVLCCGCHGAGGPRGSLGHLRSQAGLSFSPSEPHQAGRCGNLKRGPGIWNAETPKPKPLNPSPPTPKPNS
jgi:hypothetical protein